MWLLLLGIVFIVLKLIEVAPVAAWPWWAVLSPLAAAALWWQFADASGTTRRMAMRRDEKRKQAKRKKSIAALGLTPKNRGSVLAHQAQVRNTSAIMNLGDNERDLPREKPKRRKGA